MIANEFTRAQDRIGKFNTTFDEKSGRIVGVNKRRLYETPFALLTNPPNNSIAIAANGTTTELAMRVGGEGPMQLTQVGAVADVSHSSNVLVRLMMRDGSGVNPLNNTPCLLSTVAGVGGKMYPLPEAIYIDEDRALVAVFKNLDGDPTEARLCFVGAKYTHLRQDPMLARVRERLKNSQFISTPYWYAFDGGSVALTACQTVQAEIEIANDHNFEIHQFAYSSKGAFNIDIVDESKGESLINAPRGTHYQLPASLFCGNGQYPYRLHEPVMVFSGQRLLVTLTDTSGSANTVYLTLGGKAVKVRNWM